MLQLLEWCSRCLNISVRLFLWSYSINEGRSLKGSFKRKGIRQQLSFSLGETPQNGEAVVSSNVKLKAISSCFRDIPQAILLPEAKIEMVFNLFPLKQKEKRKKNHKIIPLKRSRSYCVSAFIVHCSSYCMIWSNSEKCVLLNKNVCVCVRLCSLGAELSLSHLLSINTKDFGVFFLKCNSEKNAWFNFYESVEDRCKVWE